MPVDEISGAMESDLDLPLETITYITENPKTKKTTRYIDRGSYMERISENEPVQRIKRWKRITEKESRKIISGCRVKKLLGKDLSRLFDGKNYEGTGGRFIYQIKINNQIYLSNQIIGEKKS